MPRSARLLAVAILLLGLLPGLRPAPASAQSLRGRILDATTRGPVGGATVRLLTPADSQQVAGTISDDAGTFALPAPGPGDYLVTVERLGYQTANAGSIRLRANGFATVSIPLQPAPIPIDSVGVNVEAESATLRAAGFYGRSKDGSGLFLLGEDLVKKSTDRMADALQGLSGVRIINDMGMTDMQLRGSTTNVFRPGGPQMCLPLVYIDGLLVADGKMPGNGRMNLETIRPTDVAGVEIYRGEASVPLQFARGGGACGVVLFWTRSR